MCVYYVVCTYLVCAAGVARAARGVFLWVYYAFYSVVRECHAQTRKCQCQLVRGATTRNDYSPQKTPCVFGA